MIKCQQLTKKFNQNYALNGVDLHIKKDAVTVIMGGSGSGKTTLLRLISRLEPVTSGSILFDGLDFVNMQDKALYVLRQRMGMVFQYSALLNSLNVFENIAFPLHEHTKLKNTVIDNLVQLKLEQVGLRGMDALMPSELSGGMAKRVALARAIVMDPDVVFFDEPTSGLDPISAAVISSLIADLNEKMKMTSIVVTHDVEAGLSIADQVILLWQGKIIAHGTPQEIRASQDARVRQFVEGRPDGPIPFSRANQSYVEGLLS
ncbi:MAG: ATP-binding cassette domain-containing protein [Mariprofundaceae bacterium]|nr:ATP-binding cassette domain-containing protein [Mariprofundaceae bacterium]